MKATDLVKFILNNEIEYHWFNTNHPVDQYEKDVVIFFYDYQLEDFRSILSIADYDVNEVGIDVVMKDSNCFALRMGSLCDYNDIDIEDIFDEDK